MQTFPTIVISVLFITSSAMSVDAATKTRKDCFNICKSYDKDGNCTKTEKMCLEVIIEEPDIITRPLTPPTQSCISADGKTVYKCN